MTKMHENELEISEDLVRHLLKTQCPHWADLTLTPVKSSGTDNALFRLGNDLIIRLPRVEWQPGSNDKTISKEYEWVPKLAECLTTPIAVPVFKGHSDEFYPWFWTISKWNKGHNPSYEVENEYEHLAKDLAKFLNEFHAIKLSNGPLSRRGVPLQNEDAETRKALNQLKSEEEIDIQAVTALWNKLVNVPIWDKNPVWIHGDFLPGNILIENNRLSAVIDFTEFGIGDPACDLIIAWSLLNLHSRKIFRANLENIDDDTWERGRGWALSIALIMLPYYKNSNPTLASLARRIINNVYDSE